jgi:hypothetical protein
MVLTADIASLCAAIDAGDDGALPILADALEEAGLLPEMCLSICIPEDNPHGQNAEFDVRPEGEPHAHGRRLAAPGRPFDGDEGRASGGGRTGYYEPDEWLVPEAAARLVWSSWSDDGDGTYASLTECLAFVREYRGRPGDFPGLAEHYPHAAAAYRAAAVAAYQESAHG